MARGRTGGTGGGRLGEGNLAAGGRIRAARDAWLVFEDEAGFTLTPPTTRTWARRGQPRGARPQTVPAPPVGHRPALLQTRPPARLVLVYRPRADLRRDGRKSLARTDYRDLLQAAHQQLGGNMVLV